MPKHLEIRDMTSMAIREVIPISVLIEVCHICNENCIHCFLAEHQEKGLTTGQYEVLFNQLVESGTFFVILTGGEPFLRKDFMDIVRMARKRRISVTIFTNGTLINEDIASELARLWVQEVHISLYSANPHVHDSITRLPGSFERSVRAIRMLRERGVLVRIKTPLMRITADGVDELRQLSQELDASLQVTTVITAKDDGDQATHALQLTEPQLSELLQDERIEKHVLSPVNPDAASIPCDTVFNGGAIDPFGNVFPCNQLQIKGGNVLEKPFGEIWRESPVFRDLREIRLGQLGKCQDCDLVTFCTRCPGLALLEDGDLLGCSAAAERIAKIRQASGLYPEQKHIFRSKI